MFVRGTEERRETKEMTSSSSADSLKEAGNKKFTAGEYEAAAELYTQAINANPPGTAILLSNRANSFLKLEEFGAALSDANKAVEIDPKYPKAYYRRASALFALGKKKEALEDFKMAAKLTPGSAEARHKVTECEKVIRREAFEEAIASEREKPVWQECEEDFDGQVPKPGTDYKGQ